MTVSTIVDKAVQLSGTEAGVIYVFDEREQAFRLRATYGLSEECLIPDLRKLQCDHNHSGPGSFV